MSEVRAEYERLKTASVFFTQPPLDAGNAITAVSDDTDPNRANERLTA